MKFSTKIIHQGSEPDATTGAVMPPIYMTSTYTQEAPGVTKGYDYTRAGNPNFTKLESLLASLENGAYATVFSSGLGATNALLSLFASGDHIVAINGLYGGTFRLFTTIFKKYGFTFSFVDVEDVEEALKSSPSLLYFESPTNPLLEIADIQTFCQLAKKANTLTVVDNTFATPYFQNPLDLGADLVLHSTTKYLGGHSDIIGGALITNHEKLKQQLDIIRMSIGVNPSPFDAWLTMRGVKTLAIRMQKHESNAMVIAKFLLNHPKVKNVYYPGLQNHKNHSIAKKQMSGFSGIVSAEFDLSEKETLKMISNYKLFTLAESLGGIESLVCHPAKMTHASIPKKKREETGVSDGLIRYSVGIEDPEDLIEDIKQGLASSS